MAVTLDQPGTEAQISKARVIRQLALFEERRQMRSPLFWVAFLASLALVGLAVNDEPATLWARSVTIAGSCLPIAVASVLLGNSAALRDRDNRAREIADAPPTDRDVRMLGLVAGAWGGLAGSVLVVIVGVVLSLSDDPAGAFLVPELLVGPLLVPVGQAMGVALGRWFPSPVVAPLFLIVLAGLFVIQDFGSSAASPFLPWRRAYTDWVQAEPRSPLLHLLYLVGLGGVLTTWASRWWKGLIVASVVVAVSALSLSGLDSSGEGVAAAVDAWGEHQPHVCEVHAGIEFCAYEGYEPWIDDWSAMVDRVQDLVPVEIGVERVQQTSVGSLHSDADPTLAHVQGRLPHDGRLTQQVLAPELGLPGTSGEAELRNSDLPACMAGLLPVFVSGQARAVVYLVLSELADPGAIQNVEPTGVRFGPIDPTFQFQNIEISRDEARLALRLVEEREEPLLSALHPRWDQLTDPDTSSAELAEWFEIPPPEIVEASSYESMECECTGDGGVSCSGRVGP